MVEVHGSYEPRFAAVREALAENLASGAELGASVVVDVDGQRVVDVWGGSHTPGGAEAWGEDTIVNVWSATKLVTNLAALVLIDRGRLDPYAPVARYWPEFAAAGKEAVEVRHLLAHTSGVPGWEAPFAVTDLYDAAAAAARLAAQPPWWQPGTAFGYHVLSQGHLVGELVRRIDGRSLRQFVAEEIAVPLGADFQIGAREADWGRIAPIVPPPPLDVDVPAGSIAARTFAGPAVDAAVANTPEWRRAEIGAVNGHGNARSLARVLSTLARGGTVDGIRLLSADTIDLIFQEQFDGTDLVLGVPIRFGIGWALPKPELLPYVPAGRVCYWGGWGGSLVVSDLDRRLTISYAMNKMAPGVLGSPRAESYVRAAYAALGEPVSAAG
jgi:CubicO group peptidase (beta-lactamase class C family)